MNSTPPQNAQCEISEPLGIDAEAGTRVDYEFRGSAARFGDSQPVEKRKPISRDSSRGDQRECVTLAILVETVLAFLAQETISHVIGACFRRGFGHHYRIGVRQSLLSHTGPQSLRQKMTEPQTTGSQAKLAFAQGWFHFSTRAHLLFWRAVQERLDRRSWPDSSRDPAVSIAV